MNDASTRAALYAELSELIGTRHAGALMSYLPSDKPATQSDVTVARSDLTTQIDRVRSELTAQIVHLGERVDVLDRRMERFEDKLDGFHDALLARAAPT